MKPINVSKLNEALQLLNEQLVWTDAPATEIVVCGGYHVSDLKALNPTEEELIAAEMVHDSRYFRSVPDDFERYVQPTGVAKCQ